MTSLERTAMTAAFMAATVAAGLALSMVPHVELVTLVVFSAGILLGAGRGALVGGMGMPLYVVANSALRGFPPSPLPLLAAQALGMAIPGLAGGLWRHAWLARGTPRRSAVWILPLVGIVLAAVYQGLTNAVFALFMSDASSPRKAVFLSGMAFGLLDLVSNGIVFAVGAPRVASALRRIARDRGWWGRPARVAAGILLGVLSSAIPGWAQDAPDSVMTSAPAAPADPPPASGPPQRLRPLESAPEPLWKRFDPRRPIEFGSPTLVVSDSLAGRETSRPAAPALPPALDSWGLGWGRTTWSVDGMPLRGPVHGFDEPPDIPLAWQGTWSERWSAAGTGFALAPTPIEGAPASQITISTGGYSRRTTEFGLFRTLGSVQLGVDFLDRIEQGRQALLAAGLSDLEELDHTRLWLRLAQVPGRRPAWSLDLSTAGEERRIQNGGTLERGVRRLQGSLRGPTLGGETRVGFQLRRQSLRLENGPGAFGEVRFDGFTVQGDWALPGIPGASAQVRWDRDRRRGVLSPRTFDGVGGSLTWAAAGKVWRGGASATAGHQEPFGFTWSGQVNAGRRVGDFEVRLSVAHEEDLPGMTVGLDRPTPEEGMAEYLESYETTENPEERTAARAGLGWSRGVHAAEVGGWAGRIRHYRLESNPLWARTSLYAPVPYPADEGDVVGAYGSLRLGLPFGFYGEGRGRVHSRDSFEVPYLARWTADGALHWKGMLFRESMDLDLAVGGRVLGSRQTPEREVYPTAGTGYVRLEAKVDNGVFTAALENLLDAYLESDLRASDFVTPFPAPGRTLYVGITFYLTQ